jgi:KDO2-lipid IV(A) lauroyltransferase
LPEGDISILRRMRRRFYWLLALGLIRLAGWVPVSAGRAICAGLARLGLRLRKSDGLVADANLARAFPELDEKKRQRLLEKSAVSLGRNLFDTLAAPRLLAAGDFIREESGAVPVGDVLARLASRGRGVFILTGHLGCWELLGGYLARQLTARGLDGLAVVTGTVHNPAVDRMLQDRRRDLGMKVLPREMGAAPLVRHLRSGGVIAVLQDQFTNTRNRDVPFFGEPAPTPEGLARLAQRYRTPVLPVAVARDRGGQGHVVSHLPVLEFKGTGDSDDLMEEFLTACNRQLETFIRRNPDQWVWFHRRWRSHEDYRAKPANFGDEMP